jgi:hypothetical protein
MSVRPVIGGQSPPYKAEHGISSSGRKAALHANAARCRIYLPRAIGGCEGRDGQKKVKFSKFEVQKSATENRKPLPDGDFGQNRENS